MATTPQAQQRLFTATEYHRMAEAGVFAPEENVELVEGQIVAMPPQGPLHAATVRQGEKADAYARAGVHRYWVIDVRDRGVHILTRPGAGGYAQINRLEEADTLDLLGTPVLVSDLFPRQRQ